jgi:hypothetical protein
MSKNACRNPCFKYRDTSATAGRGGAKPRGTTHAIAFYARKGR